MSMHVCHAIGCCRQVKASLAACSDRPILDAGLLESQAYQNSKLDCKQFQLVTGSCNAVTVSTVDSGLLTYCPLCTWLCNKRLISFMLPTGYEHVTTQAALDMQSGVIMDPMQEFFAWGQHPQQEDTPAIGLAALTLSLKQGQRKSPYMPVPPDTHAVGMACESITGAYPAPLFCS